jgi:1-deoxy-D-xylulose-5-phosphate reductoisomerase
MGHHVKRLAILGSTGSIGRQVLEVVRSFPDRFQVVALAGGKNTSLLAQQTQEFSPELIFAQNPDDHVVRGARYLSLEEIASHPDVDLVVIATSGRAGLMPTLSAIHSGKTIALANKETLVMAGGVVIAEAHRHGVAILPIDSELSAIWQCLQGEERGQVARIILTASGGPFRNYSREELARVTREEALKHPTWRMGGKVTIDAATLMNKGLEVIESHWLFDIPFDHIEAVLHPESIVHSLVEFADGSVKGVLSPPDMRLPIQYALSYPERWPNLDLPRLDLAQVHCLNFEPIDIDRFPCFELAVEAGRKGGTYPAVLCAADEVAVELFLQNKLGFLEMAKLVESVLSQHRGVSQAGLEDILAADAWAREIAKSSTSRAVE